MKRRFPKTDESPSNEQTLRFGPSVVGCVLSHTFTGIGANAELLTSSICDVAEHQPQDGPGLGAGIERTRRCGA